MESNIAFGLLVATVLTFYKVAMKFFQKFRAYIKRYDIELLHFTTKANADSIINTNAILAGKDEHCYFFIKSKKSISAKKYKDNKLDNTDTVIVVKGLSYKQYRNYSFDTRIDVFRHKGDFTFCEDNSIRVYNRTTFESSAYVQTRRK